MLGGLPLWPSAAHPWRWYGGVVSTEAWVAGLLKLVARSLLEQARYTAGQACLDGPGGADQWGRLDSWVGCQARGHSR